MTCIVARGRVTDPEFSDQNFYFPQPMLFFVDIVLVQRKGSEINLETLSGRGAGIAQSVWWLATGWTFRGSNPSGDEIFRTRPERPWGPPLSCTMGTGYFSGVKRPRRGADHPPLLVPKSGNSRTIPLPPSGASVLLRSTFNFTLSGHHGKTFVLQ
jgi:hypothetical protein